MYIILVILLLIFTSFISPHVEFSFGPNAHALAFLGPTPSGDGFGILRDSRALGLIAYLSPRDKGLASRQTMCARGFSKSWCGFVELILKLE